MYTYTHTHTHTHIYIYIYIYIYTHTHTHILPSFPLRSYLPRVLFYTSLAWSVHLNVPLFRASIGVASFLFLMYMPAKLPIYITYVSLIYLAIATVLKFNI